MIVRFGTTRGVSACEAMGGPSSTLTRVPSQSSERDDITTVEPPAAAECTPGMVVSAVRPSLSQRQMCCCAGSSTSFAATST